MKKKNNYLLGVDDTDSQFGHCTTYLGYRLVSRLIKLGSRITGYPRLVRLNPNVPFKTRGNAAVAIEFEGEGDSEEIFEETCSTVEEFSDVENGANSGLVLLDSASSLLPFFEAIYRRALVEIVNKRGVMASLAEKGVKVFTLGNGMGIVGAAASIGFDNSSDHTYELLAYRKREDCGALRVVDKGSVIRMDRETFPHTFNNYDYQRERILITPHGPDPVFLGIRGDAPRVLLEAFRAIRFSEELEGHMIYISNQCTGAHLGRNLSVPLKAYSSGKLTGTVSNLTTGDGGHLYFGLKTRGGSSMQCAVYEPSGDLKKVAQFLLPGDVIEAAGGVRRSTSKHEPTINVERIHVLSLAPLPATTATKNPRCEDCGTRMKSEGRGKGFQCRSCGKRASEKREEKRIRVLPTKKRHLIEGIYLVPSPRAQRHLTKPLTRYGRETDGESSPLIRDWISASDPKLLQVPVRSPR